MDDKVSVIHVDRKLSEQEISRLFHIFKKHSLIIEVVNGKTTVHERKSSDSKVTAV